MLDPALPLADRPVDRLAKTRALSAVADAWQPVVRSALEAGGAPLNSALHGTPLGHPLHPALTDIPVGAWTVSALLDGLELAGKSELSDGADAALAIGLAGAAAAALTGWAEWSDTEGEAKALGLAHAALNVAATGAYGIALVLRKTNRRRAGLALSLSAYALVCAAAYLGGELAFGLQLGVKHTAEPVEPPERFVSVLDFDELQEGAPRKISLGGVPVVLTRLGETVSAVSSVCTHRGGPLDEGTVAAGCVRCPWHGSRFELRNGAVADGPAAFPLARFETRVRGGRVEVRARA